MGNCREEILESQPRREGSEDGLEEGGGNQGGRGPAWVAWRHRDLTCTINWTRSPHYICAMTLKRRLGCSSRWDPSEPGP